jgi:hypothetical protein
MQSNFDDMSLQGLCDILASKTNELIQLIERRSADGYALRDLRVEVEKIQEVIKSRKDLKVVNTNHR